MIHLCFIIDNSLTMDQRPHNGMSLLDCVKSTIQTTLRGLSRLGFPNTHEHIHLFCTSKPRTHLSSFQHDEAHLYCQLKSISPGIDTDPALAIQTAIEHISRFRILSQAETLKGYRQAFLYQPALIVFFSDRMTRIKIQKLTSFIEGRLGMRSEYQLAPYLVGFPSYTERGQLTQEGFRGISLNQTEIALYNQALRKINSELKFVMSYDGLTTSLWNRIEIFKPSLLFHFELKEIKQKLPQFVTSQRGTAYFKLWQDLLKNIPFQLVPTKLWKIPLPYATKCSEDGQRRIQGLGSFKFLLDLSKRYVQTNSTIMPENRYKILANSATITLQNEIVDESFPIFFEYKGVQCPIGLLRLSPKSTQASFFFANFQTLNGILKMLQQKQAGKALESTIYQYLQSIPHFYHKFLKLLFDKLGISIDYQLFENPLANSPLMTVQSQLESMRLVEKRNLPKIFQANLENHQKYRAECCPTYSANPQGFQQQQSSIKGYFGDLVGQLLAFKKRAGIEDYLSSNQIDPVPMIRQLEKYNNLKKIGQDDFNENITINFGNPYRKKRKTDEHRDVIIAKETETVIQKEPEPAIESSKMEEEVIVQPKTVSAAHLNEQARKVKEGWTSGDAQKKARRVVQVKRPKSKQAIQEITDQTLLRVHALPVNKQMQLRFNPTNLATSKLIKNQKIFSQFFQKWKKN